MKITLASGSPRRKWLLRQAGIKFDVVVPDVDETQLRGELPKQMVKRLAVLKARAIVLKNKKVTRLILSADTTVVAPDGKRVLGKPRHLNEAKKMLGVIAGKKHTVITGYCILKVKNGKIISKKVRSVSTSVFIKKLSKLDIKKYLQKGESMDKAGAYAAQGFGMVLIQKTVGSYTNVVGLPLTEVLDDLRLMNV